MRALAGFAFALKFKYQDMEIGFDFEKEEGLADSGDFDNDLSHLVISVGEAAAERATAVVLFIDELQYVPEEQLTSLIMALHGAHQTQLQITMMAAGLPQLIGQTAAPNLMPNVCLSSLKSTDSMRRRRSRRFACPPKRKARPMTTPQSRRSSIRRSAIPTFCRSEGSIAGNAAQASPITLSDAKQATLERWPSSTAAFSARFDRLPPAEKRYVRAMAELGVGPHRSGDIEEMIGGKVTNVAPIRDALIAKAMIFSPMATQPSPCRCSMAS